MKNKQRKITTTTKKKQNKQNVYLKKKVKTTQRLWENVCNYISDKGFV